MNNIDDLIRGMNDVTIGGPNKAARIEKLITDLQGFAWWVLYLKKDEFNANFSVFKNGTVEFKGAVIVYPEVSARLAQELASPNVDNSLRERAHAIDGEIFKRIRDRDVELNGN
jgi:hypothetical protein